MAMKIEKILSCICVVMILMSVVPVSVFATSSSDNTIEITSRSNETFFVESEELLDVIFEGTVTEVATGLNDWICEAKVDKVISGEYIFEGETVHITLSLLPCGTWDDVEEGDKIKVYGQSFPTYCLDCPLQVSVCGRSSYYLKKISSECLSISVWTDKSKYKIGETVTIYYQTNTACTAKLTVTKPDGTQVVVGGPNDIPICTRSKSAAAGYPTGTRTVTFEARTSDKTKIATCYFDVVEDEEETKPVPKITKVGIDPSTCVKEDEYATIYVTVANNGGASNEGYISVSFPNDEYVYVVSGTGNKYNTVYQKKDPIWNSAGVQMKAVYPLVELYDTDWKGGQKETITMNVKPNSGSDEIEFLVRAALKNDADGDYERDPTYSGDTDQQGWYVKKYSVDVCDILYEIKFEGKVIEPDNEYLDDLFDCKVKIDRIISNPGNIDIKEGDEVLVEKFIWCDPGGTVDDWYFETGDKVEAYGKISKGDFSCIGHSDSSFLVDLCGSNSYYFKKIEVNKPDLIIQDISWNPSNPTENDEVTFHYTIKNQGDADTKDFTTALYIDGERYDISARGSFKAEESNDRFFTRTWTATCGDHAIKVIADDLSEIGESEEGNNERTETVSVECPDTDYIIQDISWSPNSPEQGDSITFTVTIKNQGVWDDSQFSVYYYIDGSYYDMDTIYGMGTGSTKTETFTWTADICGNVHVKAVADANIVIPESNEGNNERIETLSIKCPTSKPDISITGGRRDYKEPLQVFFKDSEVHVTVQNPAEYTYVVEYWEDDLRDNNNRLVIDEGDEWIKEETFEAKTTSESEFDLILEDLPIGLYRVKIDGTDYVSNNFYVIFNPLNIGLSEEEIDDYWRSEETGLRTCAECRGLKQALCRLFAFLFGADKRTMTRSRDSDMLLIMASNRFPYTTSSYAERRGLIFNYNAFLQNHLIERDGEVPPSDIIVYINDIKSGNDIFADCDGFSVFLVSLLRASGIPARCIFGYGDDLVEGPNEWGHVWVEACYDGGDWHIWDPRNIDSDCGDMRTSYSEYGKCLIDTTNLIRLNGVVDENYVDRGPLYGAPSTSILGSIKCPANLHAYDSQGRHVGVNAQGDIDLEIPSAYYTGPDSEPESIMILNQTEDITFKVDALDIGEFDFTLIQNSDTKTTNVTYLDVQVTETTEATVDVSEANPTYTMEIDKYGDGTTIETKKPDSIEIDAGQDSYSIPLHTGWNLISLHLMPTDTDVLDVMSSLDGNWNSVWSYETDNWKRYDLTGPDFLNDLTTIEPGKGYWINMKSEDTLSVSGSEPTTKSISLSAGWNLVGYNSLSSKSTTEAMNSVTGNWNSVWSYESGNWKRYDLTGPDFLNDLTTMEPGKGYWMDMKSSDTWTLGA